MEVVVSIIIPHFNRFELLKETISSVQNQTFKKWEIIIVDDGSTNETFSSLKEYAQHNNQIIVTKRTSSCKGPSACRNDGVALAKGEFLIFLDSDDLITESCLENRVGYMHRNMSLDFAVFTQGVFKERIGDSNVIFSKFYASKNEYLENFISDNHPWQTSAPIWKKSSFTQLKGFREDYTIMEDPELHIRALLSNFNFEVIKGEPDFYYRMLPKSVDESNAFWKNSIIGRVTFFKDTLVLLKKYNAWPQYKTALRKGIVGFLKNMLLYRCTQFPNQLNELLVWAKINKLISSYQLFLVNQYVQACNNKNYFLKKGIIYKLIN